MVFRKTLVFSKTVDGEGLSEIFEQISMLGLHYVPQINALDCRLYGVRGVITVDE